MQLGETENLGWLLFLGRAVSHLADSFYECLTASALRWKYG